jgi:MFS family permease
MDQLDATIVNTAIPAMSVSLGVSPLGLKSVMTSYILSLAVCITLSGWVADRWGTRRVFGSAVALFTVSSFLCGISNSLEMLIASRILQGISAALMMPVGRLLIVRTFEKSELLKAMNFVIVPALIGPLLGPTIGGLIVHWFSWHMIFFINIPIGIAILCLVKNHVPQYRSDEKKPFDEVIEQHGVTILIDPKALMYLIGTEMDYHNDQFKSGFVFVNPNEKGKCGCGKSFNV